MASNMEQTWEPLSRGYGVWVSPQHRFSTDTLLLAQFSMPRRGERCADFGTGCGAIPVLWCARSEAEMVYAVEIQQDACGLLSQTIARNGLSGRLKVLCADLCSREDLKPLRELHVVACNPPYKPVGTGILCREKAESTARHETDCTIEAVAEAAARVLRYGGRFCVCQRPERLGDVMEAFRKHGLEPKRLQCVQQRRGKAPFLFLLEGRKGGKPFLKVEPVLFVEEAGQFTKEMMAIYGDYKQNPVFAGKQIAQDLQEPVKQEGEAVQK